MKQVLLISIFCPDKTGLIAAITGALFDLNANLGDTSFAVLGGGAEFTTICESPSSPTEIETYLQALPELENANIKVSVFDMASTHGANANITHRITVWGSNHPGLMARLTEVFIGFEANIVRLNAEKIPGETEEQYLIHISAYIPQSRASACLASVSNTASSLQMHCRWMTVESMETANN
jgi:glycine cleavage system transcriptional repressor